MAACLWRALRRRRTSPGRDPLRLVLGRRHHREAFRGVGVAPCAARAGVGHGSGRRPPMLVRRGLRHGARGHGRCHGLGAARYSAGVGLQPGAPKGPIPRGTAGAVTPHRGGGVLGRFGCRQERSRLLRTGRAQSRRRRPRTIGGVSRRHIDERRDRSATRVGCRPLHQGQGLAERGHHRARARARVSRTVWRGIDPGAGTRPAQPIGPKNMWRQSSSPMISMSERRRCSQASRPRRNRMVRPAPLRR